MASSAMAWPTFSTGSVGITRAVEGGRGKRRGGGGGYSGGLCVVSTHLQVFQQFSWLPHGWDLQVGTVTHERNPFPSQHSPTNTQPTFTDSTRATGSHLPLPWFWSRGTSCWGWIQWRWGHCSAWHQLLEPVETSSLGSPYQYAWRQPAPRISS